MSDKTQPSNFAFEPEIITLNDAEFPDFEILIPEQTNCTEEDEFADLPDLIPFDDLDEKIPANTNNNIESDTLQLYNLSELIRTENEYNMVCYVLKLLFNKITTSLDKYKNSY